MVAPSNFFTNVSTMLVIEDFILFKEQQDKSLLKDYKNKFELD